MVTWGHAPPMAHIIDGFPIAVWLARAVRSQVLKAEAGYGYCAAKRGYYYGLKFTYSTCAGGGGRYGHRRQRRRKSVMRK